jgi:hypothetical protein
MKFLLVVALVAGVRAEAEADPQLLLHTPLVYGAHHAVPHLPVVKSVEVKPAEVKTTPLVTYAHVPYAFNYGLWGHGLPVVLPAAAPVAEAEPAVEAERKKREAEAEADPEADPYYLTYGLHHPYTYGIHYPYVKPVVKTVEVKTPAVTYAYNHLPYTYGYHGVYPYSYGYPYVVTKPVEAEEPAVEAERKKREAEAEADPEADPYYLTYGLHHPYTYGLHYPYTAPVVKPVVKTVEVKAPAAVTYAYNHLPYTYGYHGYYPYSYGYPYVVTKPVEAEEPAVEAERKKREAEADPAILASSTVVKTPLTYTYPTYGAHALTYGAAYHPYTTHGVYSGFGYPYAYGLYGK